MSQEMHEPPAAGTEGKSDRVAQQVTRREGKRESPEEPERVDLVKRLRQVLEVRILD